MNPDQPSQSPERPIDVERAEATLRTMSESELAELHAQAPDALKPGAWEVVDQEISRRARVKLRQASGARLGGGIPTTRQPSTRRTVCGSSWKS